VSRVSRRRAALLLALGAAAVLLVAVPAGGRERRPPPESKQVEAVSRAVYEKLGKVQEAMDAENWTAAASALQGILTSGELNAAEESLVHQTFGYVHSGQQQYAKAIASFEKALALGGLPDTAQVNTQFNLGQLYLLTDQNEKGIRALEAWFAKAENPSAPPYLLLANAYAEKGDYRTAWRWAQPGLDKMDPPRESWMALAAQLSLQLENYREARRWLERLVDGWPKRTYWMQLVAVYGETNEPRKALVAMEMADRQGFLTTSQDRVRLAQLHLVSENPYRAGLLLEDGMANGSIEKSRENYELLANAWTLAREYERALGPLAQAAELSREGKLWVRLGQLHLDAERWGEAEQALRKGIARGGLEHPGEARLLLGIALYQGGRHDAAREAFESAARDPSAASQARQWLQTLAASQS
jgi:tetratricopeptide (TPR) repeat protein